jgi:hypothetical protein
MWCRKTHHTCVLVLLSMYVHIATGTTLLLLLLLCCSLSKDDLPEGPAWP